MFRKTVLISCPGGERTGLGRATSDYFSHLKYLNPEMYLVKRQGRYSLDALGTFNCIYDLFFGKKFDEIICFGLVNPLIVFMGKRIKWVVFDLHYFEESGFKPKILRVLTKLFVAKVSEVLPVSNWAKEEILRFTPSVSVGNIIGEEIFIRSARSNYSDHAYPIVLVVTTSKANKNIDFLEKLLQKNVETQVCHFIVVGRLKSDYRHCDQVTGISDELMQLLFLNADFVLLASLREGLSYPAVDAFKLKKKLISFDLPGLQWLSGYDGWLKLDDVSPASSFFTHLKNV